MKRFRLFVVLMLSFAVPFVASAGVRMQVAMNQGPLQTAAMSGMSMSSGDGCDMKRSQTNVPGKSMPCCQDKSGQDCKICNLPASVTPGISAFCPSSLCLLVVVSSEIARFSDAKSGLWRPPRQF